MQFSREMNCFPQSNFNQSVGVFIFWKNQYIKARTAPTLRVKRWYVHQFTNCISWSGQMWQRIPFSFSWSILNKMRKQSNKWILPRFHYLCHSNCHRASRDYIMNTNDNALTQWHPITAGGLLDSSERSLGSIIKGKRGSRNSFKISNIPASSNK